MEAAVRQLTAHGVALTPFENEQAKFVWFADPDGAPLYFIQTKTPDHR